MPINLHDAAVDNFVNDGSIYQHSLYYPECSCLIDKAVVSRDIARPDKPEINMGNWVNYLLFGGKE